MGRQTPQNNPKNIKRKRIIILSAIIFIIFLAVLLILHSRDVFSSPATPEAHSQTVSKDSNPLDSLPYPQAYVLAAPHLPPDILPFFENGPPAKLSENIELTIHTMWHGFRGEEMAKLNISQLILSIVSLALDLEEALNWVRLYLFLAPKKCILSKELIESIWSGTGGSSFPIPQDCHPHLDRILHLLSQLYPDRAGHYQEILSSGGGKK